jgi:hypothetical protein
VAVAEVSGTVEDYTSCSDEATEEDKRSVVVRCTVKAVGACCGGRVGMSVSALYEKDNSCPADET